MAIYQMAMQQGASALEAMFTGSNAQTRAAFDAAYSAQTKRINAMNAKHAAQLNIAGLQQDKVMTDAVIQMNQREAEAQAKVMAAAQGTQGSSLEQRIAQTEINESFAYSRASSALEQATQTQLTAVYNADSGLHSVRDAEFSQLGSMLQVASSLSLDDIQQGVETAEGWFAKDKQTFHDEQDVATFGDDSLDTDETFTLDANNQGAFDASA